MSPIIVRRFGFTLTAMAVVLAYVLRHALLPLPLVTLFVTQGALRYITAYLPIRKPLKIVAAVIAALPLVWFVYVYNNTQALWLTMALAIIGSGGIVLLVAPPTRRERAEQS